MTLNGYFVYKMHAVLEKTNLFKDRVADHLTIM